MDKRLQNAINRGKSQRATNAENSQQTAKNTESVQPDDGNAQQKQNTSTTHTATNKKKNDDDKFTAFDSLRHQFDTHREVKKTEYIAGLFARGGVTILAGASGVGKTTLEQLIVHELSLGGDILNGFAHEDKPRKSIIIAGELGERGLTERAQEYAWHSDMNYVEVVDLLDFEEAGFSLTINEATGRENIEHLAQTPGLDVLFIDSFGMFYNGKENDNDTLRETFHWLNKTARKHDIAIAITHHSRKRLSSEQQKPLTLDDIIGGNAISRYVHRVIAVEYNASHKVNTVTCLKSWGPYFKTFTYSKKLGFCGAEPYIEIDIDPGEINITKNNKLTPPSQAESQRREIITILKTKREPATMQEIRNILGVSENNEKEINSLRVNLKRMIDSGEIIKPDNKRGIYALPEPEHLKEEDNTAQTVDDSININFEENDSE